MIGDVAISVCGYVMFLAMAMMLVWRAGATSAKARRLETRESGPAARGRHLAAVPAADSR